MAARLGLVGKTNTGKTTFFNATTPGSGEVSAYPFTTKTHSEGTAYATTPCVHVDMNTPDQPSNTRCIDGYRHVPVILTDLPGLISDAWRGRGMGNRFLSVASRSDALLHVVDASGGIDPAGMLASPGTGDPVSDFADIEAELVMWYRKILEGNRDKISRAVRSGLDLAEATAKYMGGMGVTPGQARLCLQEAGVGSLGDITIPSSKKLAGTLRRISKPTVIIANKMDVEGAEQNYARLKTRYPDYTVVPASGHCERILREAGRKKIIRYPAEKPEVQQPEKVDKKIQYALEFAEKPFMRNCNGAGAQAVINQAVFGVLGMVSAYPVADPNRLVDGRNMVLPDLHLLERGSTIRDLARAIHHGMAKGSIRAMIVNRNRTADGDYTIRDRDIIHIVPQSGRRPAKKPP